MSRDDEALYARAAGIRLAVFDCDGVFTDGRLWLGDDGAEYKSFHVHDGAGIVRLIDAGVEVAVISGRKSPAVRRRMQELGVRHLVEGCEDKLSALRELQQSLGVDDEDTACIGDDLPDLPLLEAAALGICVADGAAELKAAADWCTTARGGGGAVREVCELLLAARKGG